MYLLIFFAAHWYFSLFFQSFFHHRYAAHRQFSMTRGWEKFFYFCCFISQGSSYISPYAYGIMHRLHHAYADSEKDPHSPHHSHGVVNTMLQTRNSYHNIFTNKTIVPEKFKKDLPHWVAFEKFANNWVTRIAWILIYTTIYFWLARSRWMFCLLPVTVMMGSVQGAVVNWWAHKFGYVNFKVKNESKNILPFDLIFWGEAFHNNHHSYPGRANNAHRWFELDTGYQVLKVMNKLRIIHLPKKESFIGVYPEMGISN